MSSPASGQGGTASASSPSVSQDDETVIKAASAPGTLPGRILSGAPADTATGPVPHVRQVGRYQIREKMGEGAMAAVYRAYDPTIDRMLAIKFLHANLCVNREYRSRFLREARAAGMLAHPNIVTVFDIGELEGRPYIAMELLEGGSLDAKAMQAGPLPISDVLKVGSQLAGALGFAHSRGIFHRDIKPSNILIVAGREQIKVTDFGIAHIEAAESTHVTRIGTIIGTPHYMSPEQAMGSKVDARSDLFSVGVVMYQMLTGVRPFNSDSVVNLVYRIVKENPKSIDSFRRDVPAALRRIVERCLQKEPDRRYQSGIELAGDLARVARQLEERAMARMESRAASITRRWPLIVGGVVAATMLTTAAIVNRLQYGVMLEQMVSHGASLSKLIATEHAAAALADDWVSIDVSVQEVAKALQLERLSVVDRAGVVRVSTDRAQVGRPFQPSRGDPIASQDAAVAISRVAVPSGPLLGFETAVRFRGQPIGRVHLALFEAPLSRVARQNWLMMLLLLCVTVGATVVAMYFLAARYARPIQEFRAALEEFGPGRMDVRINSDRADELGLLFRAFDRMAERLERQYEPKAAAPVATGDDAPASCM